MTDLRVRLNPKAFWLAIARQSMSQKDMAFMLGVSNGYMSQLVHGTRRPSPRLRRKILKLLNPMTFDDLFIIENRSDD